MIDDKFYMLYRATPIKSVQEYLNNPHKIELKKEIMEFDYKDLLIVQSSKSLWEELLLDPDFFIRRKLCASLYKLNQEHIACELNVDVSAVNRLFNKTVRTKEAVGSFKLSVMLNHPWQLLMEKEPIEHSFQDYTEYKVNGSAKEINVENLYQERANVNSISGYYIKDPYLLFEQELIPITARWVKTYPEMEYLEFHLRSEPVLDKRFLKNLLNVFPFAKNVITSYTPFRKDFRSLWILGSKPGKEEEYKARLKELEYRDLTVIK